eukprot:3044495-Amphidinium_carterae.1
MAVSNRFNRLTAEQLDDCIDAFRILEEEGIGRVRHLPFTQNRYRRRLFQRLDMAVTITRLYFS